ncbi:hypothetical protein [Luteolibacter sp. LG18]|uniref:hypothetical protein n=1 Tax=Luteolibacter sp. LG18 TaxID=2819286 RepID=UPI002B2D9C0F|nr:hypothetical protein llg_23600 [Luteolibacter sp. LG18]
MSASFLEYVRFGRIEGLQLGLTRTEVSEKLGPPNNWIGKPPMFGPIVPTAEEADVWLYYHDAAGIRFDERGVSDCVNVYPESIDLSLYPFLGWPFGAGAKMLDVRRWLIGNGVSFLDGHLGDEYYILAERRCLVVCFPYKDGQSVPDYLRKIVMMLVVADEADLPDFVREELEITGGRNGYGLS